MTRVHVEPWIGVPDDQEHAPDASLDGSSRTAETLADTACDSWDDYTDHELFLASTSDSLVLDDSVPSGSESVPTVESQNALYAATSWGTTWTWHKGWNHDTAQVAPSPAPCQQSASIDELQVHGPWRTPRNQKEQPHLSWRSPKENEVSSTTSETSGSVPREGL